MVYYIESELAQKEYMRSLRQRFTTPFAVFSERVTGVAIGPFFSVAYYRGYTWNRRITNECNRAFGFVKTVDGKTQAHFLYSRGMLSPFWILFYAAIPFLIFLFTGVLEVFPMYSVFCFVLALGVCCTTAFLDSLTEDGITGRDVLTDLLLEPDQFYYC